MSYKVRVTRYKLQNFIVLLLATFCLQLVSACGFTPVYSQKSEQATTTQTNLSDIKISIIPNREGQFLRNALIDRLYMGGEPTNPRYTLTINAIKEKIYNFDITVDSEATRRQLKLNTKMTLTDNQTGKKVLAHNLLSIASHNVLESEFSTLVTEQTARENALTDLARQIERQLVLYFAQ